jgi:hypothetical protein
MATMSRRGRRRGPAEGARITRLDGEDAQLHGHALLWGYIISETVRQLSERDAERAKREAFVREHWQDDRPPEPFVQIRREIKRPRDGDADAPKFLTIMLSCEAQHILSTTPQHVTVEFALCRQGEVRAHCEGMLEGAFAGPFIAPRDAREAETSARALVELAIKRLYDHASLVTKRTRGFK